MLIIILCQLELCPQLELSFLTLIDRTNLKFLKLQPCKWCIWRYELPRAKELAWISNLTKYAFLKCHENFFAIEKFLLNLSTESIAASYDHTVASHFVDLQLKVISTFYILTLIVKSKTFDVSGYRHKSGPIRDMGFSCVDKPLVKRICGVWSIRNNTLELAINVISNLHVHLIHSRKPACNKGSRQCH